MLNALALLLLAQQPAATLRMLELPSAPTGFSRSLIRADDNKLAVSQKSPKQGWEFEYAVVGYGRETSADPFSMRVRTFSQFRKQSGDPAWPATRMVMRMWELANSRLSLDHPEQTGHLVDVYLCYGGTAGGEQMLDKEERGGRMVPVSTIYIYDITSFTDPVEMAREIAHEYGHAILPGVEGFRSPENWANGYLGEKLFLTYIMREMQAGNLKPADVMDVPLADLQAWLRKNADPLADAVANAGPDWTLLSGGSAASMQAYIGTVLWSERVLTAPAFARSLILNSDATAKGAAKAIVEAVEEKGASALNLKGLNGRTVWLPLGKVKPAGVKILSAKNGWANCVIGSGGAAPAPKAAASKPAPRPRAGA